MIFSWRHPHDLADATGDHDATGKARHLNADQFDEPRPEWGVLLVCAFFVLLAILI